MIDDVIEVTDEDAIETTREPSTRYGLLVGFSAPTWAARQLPRISGSITTVLPDRGTVFQHPLM